MSRFTAFAIHLGISFLIFLVLAYMVVIHWYPDILFHADGGWRGIAIITLVDLVLGPTLTLVVFKSGKKGLRTDLTFIGFLQFTCLCAGTFVVYDERPIAVVYNDGRFSVMTNDDYRNTANAAVPDLRHFPGDAGPKWVMVDVPTDPIEEADFRKAVLVSGQLISSMTDYYIPFSTSNPQFTDQSVAPEEIAESEGWQQEMDRWLDEHGGMTDDYSFYTFSTRYFFGYLVYNRESLEPVGLMTRVLR